MMKVADKELRQIKRSRKEIYLRGGKGKNALKRLHAAERERCWSKCTGTTLNIESSPQLHASVEDEKQT